MASHVVYKFEDGKQTPVAWFNGEKRASDYAQLMREQGETATYEELGILKVEIAIDDKKAIEQGYIPESVWEFIDNLFCGERRHMKKEVHGDTRFYITEDDESESWGSVMTGMSFLKKQEWFWNCATKMYYHRSDGWLEDVLIKYKINIPEGLEAYNV